MWIYCTYVELLNVSVYKKVSRVWVRAFKATFNNISVISWQSVLLVEETGVAGENHRPVTSHWQTWSHNVVSSIPRLIGIWTHNISSDCIGSCKSNYHTIMTMTAHRKFLAFLAKYVDTAVIQNYSIIQ